MDTQFLDFIHSQEKTQVCVRWSGLKCEGDKLS